ncbi:MAG TPA: hypothetical protein VMM78_15850 [Thermomicrobiales bacterium]|nr:hypothetical protein [Thermomicrobiales bacterium]
MSRRQVVIVTVALFGCAAAITAGVLYARAGRGGDVMLVLPMLTIGLTGTLILIKQPHNRVGWVLYAGGMLLALAALGHSSALHVTLQSRSSLATWPLWFSSWAFPSGYIIMVIGLLLLYPTGRLPSPRWRPAAWAVTGYFAVLMLGTATMPRPMEDIGDPGNPVYVPNPAGLAATERIETVVSPIVYLLIPVFLLVALLAFGIRVYRATGVERQQIKWLAWTFAVVITIYLPFFALSSERLTNPVLERILGAASFLFMAIGIPIAIGIAILRYRLYDIDRIINRTLVYAGLTVSLSAMYLSLILTLGAFGREIAGYDSTVGVAVSTLAVAALVRPLRGRIQSVVDRRFFRSKYDAVRTVEAFSTRLRDDIDLPALVDELQAVITETVQPAHITVWLRRPRAGSDGGQA